MSLVRHTARREAAVCRGGHSCGPPELATLKAEYPDVQVRCGELDVDFLCTASELLVSPGLAVSAGVAETAARGVKLSGDIELFAREARAPIVAITGSNAKSTVTTTGRRDGRGSRAYRGGRRQSGHASARSACR